jgi:ADP-heptose:LPS heptosyltransferase
MSRPAVLAACTTAIGDTVLCTPALMALGRDFDVDVLVHQHRLPLLLHNPFLRQLYPYRNNPLFRLYLAGALAGKRYHRLLVMHANDDLMKLMPWLRYQKASSIQGWRNPHLKIDYLALDPTLHLVDRRIMLARWAGAHPQPEDRAMRVFLTGEELARGERWLEDKGLSAGRPRVGLVLGASHVFKRWPEERFGLVARDLARQGVGVVILGGGHEVGLAERAQAAAGEPLPMGHQLDLRLLSSILARLDVLVTNDTGPLHLCQAVNTPVLGLFGPTDPFTIGPREAMHRVIKVPAICEPCLTKTCPDAKCMRAIPTERVLEVVGDMLARPQFGRGGEGRL